MGKGLKIEQDAKTKQFLLRVTRGNDKVGKVVDNSELSSVAVLNCGRL